ncbi:MAG: DUF3891 family protein [Candidatus Tectomicrobia bacterium]|nr:DUF3891 family protein [Candidatus Tectomicrobia bacterium]
MIIHDWNGDLMVIYQMDHGDLAAQFERSWGNTTFAPAEPSQAMAHATSWHDNGWIEYDAKPRVNPQTRRPYRLHEVPATEHLEFYKAGIGKVIREDAYAGLLVSMHLTGLYQQRYGLDGGMPSFIERAAPEARENVRAFIAQLEREQAELRARLQHNPAYAAAVEDRWLWTNYRLLQVFDQISLFFCFFRPGATRTIKAAPRTYDGAEVTLRVTALDASRVVVVPFPFAHAETEVTLRVKRLPNRTYADDDDVRATLNAAPFQALRYILAAVA